MINRDFGRKIMTVRYAEMTDLDAISANVVWHQMRLSF